MRKEGFSIHIQCNDLKGKHLASKNETILWTGKIATIFVTATRVFLGISCSRQAPPQLTCHRCVNTLIGYMDHHSERTTIRESKLKQELLTRLKRIEGQVRGVTGMVQEDVYCDQILHQISAVRAALDAVGKQVLENHLRECLVDRIQAGESEVIDELMVTVRTLLK